MNLILKRPSPGTQFVHQGKLFRKTLLLLTLAGFCLVQGFDVRAVEPQNPAAAGTGETSSQPGLEDQVLTFNIYWKTASAGVATIRVERGENPGQVKIVGEARSSRFVSTLYRVEDQFESLVFVKDFCSLRLVKHQNEGRRHRESILNILPEKHQAVWQEHNLSTPTAPMKRVQAQSPACVQDVLSALFYMRTQPLTLGESVQFPVNDNGKTYNLTVEIQQRETVKTDAGTFQAIRVEPKVFGGLFKRPGRMYVWFSDDDERRILQLKARISIGTITALLTNVPGPQSSATANLPQR